MTTPLGGVVVAELGDDVGVALCGRMLAGLGATVVRVEPAGGCASRQAPPLAPDGHSLLFGYLNAGTQSVSEALRPRVLAAADIVLAEDAGAGQDGAHGGPIELDGLVAGGRVVALVGGGPELLEQAAGGLMALVGAAGREPLALAGHQAGYAAGLQAFTSVLVALTHRDRTGEGQLVRVSRAAAVAYLEWKGPVYAQSDGRPLRRGHSGGPLVLPAADGHVAFYYRPSDWDRVLQLFDDDRLRAPHLRTHAGRLAHEPELRAVLAEHTGRRPKAESYADAQRLGIPVGAVATMADLLADPQYRARDFLARAADGAVYPALPFTLDGRRPRIDGPAPAPGAHDPYWTRRSTSG